MKFFIDEFDNVVVVLGFWERLFNKEFYLCLEAIKEMECEKENV